MRVLNLSYSCFDAGERKILVDFGLFEITKLTEFDLILLYHDDSTDYPRLISIVKSFLIELDLNKKKICFVPDYAFNIEGSAKFFSDYKVVKNKVTCLNSEDSKHLGILNAIDDLKKDDNLYTIGGNNKDGSSVRHSILTISEAVKNIAWTYGVDKSLVKVTIGN